MATAVRAVDRFDPEQQKLSPVEKMALDHIRECAREERQLTQVGLTIAIGSGNFTGSTAAGVLNRLEQKGYITRTYYQRGLQACDVETGICTPAPTCRSTHWRQRTKPAPTLPLHVVRQRDAALSTIIEAEARLARTDLHTFMMDLMFNGLELWLEQREGSD